MDQKKFDIKSELRVEEKLTELCEEYGVENVKQTLLKLIPNLVANKVENNSASEQPRVKVEEKNPMPANQTGNVAVDEDKPKLRPNARNFNEFVMALHQIQQSEKNEIGEPIVNYLNNFLANAKLILDGNHSQVPESFYMSLASRKDFDFRNEDEEWIVNNIEIILKQLKNKLRKIGYDFLDNDAEVGQIYDPKIHNCIEYIYTPNEPYKDRRILRVVDEGIIIKGVLHINANVVVGKAH